MSEQENDDIPKRFRRFLYTDGSESAELTWDEIASANDTDPAAVAALEALKIGEASSVAAAGVSTRRIV